MILNSIKLAGRDVLPIIEGGKGIALSNGLTAGRFASCGAVGTFSGVNPDIYDLNGNVISKPYIGKSRFERQNEMIDNSIIACLEQAKIAHEESKGNGLVFMNILWEQGGAQRLLSSVLEKAKGLIKAVSCGAGMPFKLAEICAENNVFYNPIISSARAFQLLWKRSYSRFKDWLGAVIYEDPWFAGGHNGFSNTDDPVTPEKPMNKLVEIRKFMNEVGLNAIPIIVAGGVWWLSEWLDYIDNDDIEPVGFQFGTRPLVTIESPLNNQIKYKLLNLDENSVKLQKFSPTGFYSSAVENSFLKELEDQIERQISFTDEIDLQNGFNIPVKISNSSKNVFISYLDKDKYNSLLSSGFNNIMKTPSNTLLMLKPDRYNMILEDMKNCVGCLSACIFSGWDQRGSLNLKPDPRSFCIQKSLQNIAHGADAENNLLFSGKMVYRFKTDPFYKNGSFIPSIKELIDQIKIGY